MRILDLCCGAGGAAMGLHQAFPDAEIVGVDTRPQPRYPFTFIHADALEFDLSGFDFVWASPPCQAYIRGGLQNVTKASRLLPTLRERLLTRGGLWVIENVPGAPLSASLLLCGSMFGLPVRRHRIFETSWPVGLAPRSCDHGAPIVGVYGHPHGARGAWPGMLPGSANAWAEALDIDWMVPSELSQAVPPSYSRYLAQFIPLPVGRVA